MFAATGVTDGDYLQGVHFFSGGATTQSVVMRSKTKTVRVINATHYFEHKPILLTGDCARCRSRFDRSQKKERTAKFMARKKQRKKSWLRTLVLFLFPSLWSFG